MERAGHVELAHGPVASFAKCFPRSGISVGRTREMTPEHRTWIEWLSPHAGDPGSVSIHKILS